MVLFLVPFLLLVDVFFAPEVAEGVAAGAGASEAGAFEAGAFVGAAVVGPPGPAGAGAAASPF
ncbi:hypothetical protein ACF09L_07475 [Streptomyces sp. NPDC014779]|uniref:hypothetical protein n=1 Tax=unclassified Streptomyces TaxID=2593676 RepID=UPI0036FFB9E3